MKRLLLCTALTFTVFTYNTLVNTSVFAQAKGNIDVNNHDPIFPGGDSKFGDYVKQNLKMPPNGKEGTVYISFIIDDQGMINSVKVERGLDDASNQEALRIITNMPQWKPAKENGVAISQKVVKPIRFIK